MTEIKIEKKKTFIPWIIAGVIILILIVYFFMLKDNKEEVKEVQKTNKVLPEVKTDLIDVKENNSIIASYINFVENDKNNMTLDHKFTNAALLKLTDAVEAMSIEIKYDIQRDLVELKQHISTITKDPYINTHADTIRKACEHLTNIMKNMQQYRFPSLENDIVELIKASEAINPDVLALKQKDAVKNYFRKAAELLKKMN